MLNKIIAEKNKIKKELKKYTKKYIHMIMNYAETDIVEFDKVLERLVYLIALYKLYSEQK